MILSGKFEASPEHKMRTLDTISISKDKIMSTAIGRMQGRNHQDSQNLQNFTQRTFLSFKFPCSIIPRSVAQRSHQQ